MILLLFAELRKAHQQKQGGHCDTPLHGCSSSKTLTSRQHRAPPPWVLSDFPLKVNQNTTVG